MSRSFAIRFYTKHDINSVRHLQKTKHDIKFIKHLLKTKHGINSIKHLQKTKTPTGYIPVGVFCSDQIIR